MEKNYNVTGEERKALLNKTLKKDLRATGFVPGKDEAEVFTKNSETAAEVIASKETSGEQEKAAKDTAENEPEEKSKLSISIPDDLTETQFLILTKLVSEMETLLKHAFLTESVELERSDGKLTFPWFNASDGDHSMAYMLFVIHFVKMAKEAKQTTVMETTYTDERDEMRGALMRIGLIGSEYKEVRKILLENLTGNSSEI